MKFYGHGIVWDGSNNRKLCKFEDGELVTNDESIINKLIDLDYSHEEVTIIENIEPEPTERVTEEEIVKKPIEKPKPKKRKKVVKRK